MRSRGWGAAWEQAERASRVEGREWREERGAVGQGAMGVGKLWPALDTTAERVLGASTAATWTSAREKHRVHAQGDGQRELGHAARGMGGTRHQKLGTRRSCHR